MSSYQSYLGWGLNNYEDFLQAFTDHKDGGWWIRKIDYKDAFNREITEGPYTEKEALLKAKTWNSYFKYKNLETAKAYSLIDLICNHMDDYKRLKEHLYEEYIWRPPEGAELFCIIKGDRKVLLFKNKRSASLEKFKLYASEKDIKDIKVKDYTIFYKKGDYVSVERAKKLKKLVIDFSEEPKTLQWLYLEAIDINSYREGDKPIIIPGYIIDFKKDIMPQKLDFFKRLNIYKTKEEKIKCLINELKPYSKKLEANDNIFTIEYILPIIYNNKDDHIKNLKISYRDKKLKIIIKEEDYDITLIDDSVRDAKLLFNFPYSNKIDFFDNSLIELFLFISKVLMIKRVILKDNLKEYCRCNRLDNMPLYINIIRYLAGMESMYMTIGFQEINKDKRLEIIDLYKNKLVDEGDENVLGHYTYESLAKDYFNGLCKYNYVCELLNKLSVEIFEKLKNCCLEYVADLNNIKLFKIKEKLET